MANDKSFLLFTEGKIVLLDTKYRVEVIFEESEDVEMGKVKPILGQECAYFVLNEVTF